MNWLIRAIFAISMLPLMAVTCTKDNGPNFHQYLDFANQADQPVIVAWNNYTSGKPLSEINLSQNTYGQIKSGDNSYAYTVLPNQTAVIFDMRGSGSCLENYLNSQNLVVFILDPQIIMESSAEELADGRAVLDKRPYTLSDLNQNGPLVVFELVEKRTD